MPFCDTEIFSSKLKFFQFISIYFMVKSCLRKLFENLSENINAHTIYKH